MQPIIVFSVLGSVPIKALRVIVCLFSVSQNVTDKTLGFIATNAKNMQKLNLTRYVL